MKALGLIAGMGELPLMIAREARAKGFFVSAVGLEGLADQSLSSEVDTIHWVNVGKLGKIIGALKATDVKEAVMAGKVPKSIMYTGKVMPDLRAVKLLFSIKNRSDDSILLAITEELKQEGITLMKTTDFCGDMLTPEGLLTKTKVTEEEWKDISFGWAMAKEIGRLDIGQTVVVKDRAVTAVEAIEGTDEAIRRGGHYAGKGAVVVKVSKPEQDMRFDVPVVGTDTLKAMIASHARVLAVEAKRSILLHREVFIEKAEKAGISVVGYSEHLRNERQ